MTVRERVSGIIGYFSEAMPTADTELDFDTTFHLLVAVILSAQCTDRRVNTVTPDLFRAYPTPEAMAGATAGDIYQFIRSISYPNNKARNLAAMARMLCSDFGGTVPSEVEELMRLPGVGRKTANVVCAVVWNREVMPVDTHVFRVSARIGLTPSSRTPRQTELRLEKIIPGHLLPIAHHWFILHGRRVCTARRPKCETCGISTWCAFFSSKCRETPPASGCSGK